VDRDPRWGVFRVAAVAAIFVLALPALAHNLAQKRQAAETQYDKAQQLREALSGRPATERTRRDYQRVIDAYRRVYYLSPISSKADPSVIAVAELLAETGRNFGDLKASRDAIVEYEFLRREYPGSKHRIQALFTIAQIYREDLEDRAAAKAAYQNFLKQYPHNRLADDARDSISEIDAEVHSANTPFDSAPGKSADRHDRTAGKRDAASKPDRLPLITSIRHWSTPDYTRIAIDLDEKVKYEAGRVPDPDRIFFDLHDTRLAPELVGKSFDVEDGFLRKIRVAQYHRGMTRIVLEVDDVSDFSAFFLPNPFRLIIDIHGQQPKQSPVAKNEKSDGSEADTLADKPEKPRESAASTAKDEHAYAQVKAADDHKKNSDDATAEDRTVVVATRSDDKKDKTEVAKLDTEQPKDTVKPTTKPTFKAVAPRSKNRKLKPQDVSISGREARPTSSGEQTLIRALGLKFGRIVVDAGHGGHDTGTIGPNGLMEKDLVLDVALRLGKLLDRRMGADVIYTRDDDTFVPLETRTAVANKEQADLFISIHANSSHDPSARGIETYYLNFTSSADALEVAARENAVSEKSIHELQDLVKKIALKEKIEESREFAADVQHSLQSSPAARGTRDRGVKKAPFIVLIGANMPSILAEISFLSNPDDERKLSTPAYRQKLAEALYRGISKYVSGLSGVKMASKLSKVSGQ
jgi:N-acetylmuramoyl-L-alanine amidase